MTTIPLSRKDKRLVTDAFVRWCKANADNKCKLTTTDAMAFYVETRKETSPLFPLRNILANWAQLHVLLKETKLID